MSWDYLLCLPLSLYSSGDGELSLHGVENARQWYIPLPAWDWLSFSVSLSVCGFLWNVLRCGRWERPVCGIRFSSVGGNHHLRPLEV